MQDNYMYVIEGYDRGKKHWYDFKKNRWVNNLLDAEFFDDINQAQWIVDEFEYNKNNIATDVRKRVLGTFIYITPVFYDDDYIAKQVLILN